ncbi:MAG: ribosome-associated translation inhibitor RaiA [Chloroflexota bacterium]
MELSIHTSGMKLSQKLETYIEKKTQKLDRYLPGLQMVNMELRQQKAKSSGERKTAQLTIRDKNGTILRAEEKNDTIYGAIDSVISKMYRQIKRYRGRRKDHRRNGASDVAEFEPIEETVEIEIEEPINPRVVKRKQFSLQPMSEDEALDQMLLLDHDFFVFKNLEGEANVLYRRKDGNIGILQPSVD